MPFEPAECFERDMGCTEAEWLAWLPGAVGQAPLRLDRGQAQVELGSGRLTLRWQALPPRRIALVQLPRLSVSFRFEGVEARLRQAFMRHFDLYMQRGGG
ncbi:MULTISPECIES: hypothetical protein [Caldimonas]|uniref:hypothetical protein n=1 Tax=Caldimonas TaxID=196013 RepID=UPI0003659540|nr:MULTISPECIES: hypothetical protein [Caldimonas]MCX7659667.1 hypothetical protein [Caldimonas manganoxidans]GIX25601.1 MAG: hypothetical protein KatS3mg122_2832 [Caldimonas sp.]